MSQISLFLVYQRVKIRKGAVFQKNASRIDLFQINSFFQWSRHILLLHGIDVRTETKQCGDGSNMVTGRSAMQRCRASAESQRHHVRSMFDKDLDSRPMTACCGRM